MNSIDLAKAPTPLGKGAPDPVPALLIGRLAVDEDYEGLGIATELVNHLGQK